jgi:hypothetical protein
MFLCPATTLCYFHDDHNGDGRISLWCPFPTDVWDELVTIEPEPFFKPSTSSRGVFSSWLGVFLDLPGDDTKHWCELRTILEDAFRNVAPKSLVVQFDQK